MSVHITKKTVQQNAERKAALIERKIFLQNFSSFFLLMADEKEKPPIFARPQHFGHGKQVSDEGVIRRTMARSTTGMDAEKTGT